MNIKLLGLALVSVVLGSACGGDGETPSAGESTPPGVTPSASATDEGTAPYEIAAEIPLELSELIDEPTFAVDAEGQVFFANVAQSRIEVFGPDGSLVRSWGVEGSGEGEFDFFSDEADGSYIGGLDIDGGGNVYVADSGNARVQRFDAKGTFLTSWGGRGNGEGEFVRPIDIAVAHDSTILVVDDRGNRIQRFSQDGEFLEELEADELDNNAGADVASNGTAYVAGYLTPRVLTFDPDGSFRGTIEDVGGSSFGIPVDVAVGPDDTTYVADQQLGAVFAFDAGGSYAFTVGSETGEELYLRSLASVAVDDAGDLYVVDEERATLYRLRPL